MDKEPSRISSLIPTFISALFTFLFGVIGVIIGASWQQPYAIQLEEQKNLLALRKNAYEKFFEGQTDLKLLNLYEAYYLKEDADRLKKEYSRNVKNAKFHIGVYSSKATVEAIVDFFDEYSPYENCDNPQKYRDDTNIYIRMREEHLGVREEDKVSPEKMTLLIHDCRLPKSQAK
jgi:hypothetical protein